MVPSKIIKRDGRVVDFDRGRIVLQRFLTRFSSGFVIECSGAPRGEVQAGVW